MTAVEGTDYSLDATTVTVPDAGMAAVTVSGMTDSFVEGAELFEISIVPNAAYTLGAPSKATVYIRDVVGSETGDGTTSDSKLAKKLYNCNIKIKVEQSYFLFDIKHVILNIKISSMVSLRDRF